MRAVDQKSVCAILSVLLLAVVGCSRESRIRRALVNAEHHTRAEDFASAQIEYLRVLQLDPRQPAALAGLGTVYYDQGRWSLAVPILVEAVQLDPENLEAQLKLASLYLAARNSEKAQQHAEFVLSRQPTNAEAVLTFADAAVLGGQTVAARQRIQQLRSSHGDQAAFHLAEALFLMNQGDDSGAEREARRAIEMNPRFDAGHLILGDVLRLQGRDAEARKSLEQAFVLADNRSRRKFRWIDYLSEKGETDAARSLLEQLDKETPNYFPVLLRRARLEFQAGDPAECQVWLDKALAVDGGSFEAMSLRCELLLAQGKTSDAIDLLKHLVELAPQSAPLSLQLAKAYLRAGDNSAALSQLNRTMALGSNLLEPRLLRIEVALRMGDARGALVWINELQHVSPENRAAQVLKAEACRLSGDLDQAASIYQGLLQKNSKDPELLFRLGQIRFLQNQMSEARALFEAAIEVDPGHLPSLSALADMDFKNQNASAAIRRMQKLLAQRPKALGPRFLLAQIHIAQGARDEAEKELKDVIELAPTWRSPYLILARLYVDSHQVEAARSRLNQLLSAHPDDERAVVMLAMLDEVQANYSSAAKRYEQLLNVHPENILAMNNLACLYSTHVPNLDRAFELASAARAKQPRDASIADTFAWVLICRGEYRRALGILREFESSLARTPEAEYHLGLVYYLAGLESPAKSHLAAAVGSDQDFFGRKDAQAKLSVLNVDPGKTDAPAVGILEQALEENAADPVALARLTAICHSTGDLARERALYEAALQSDPSSVTALLGLARLLAATPEGQARAMELAKTARSLLPGDPVVAYTLATVAFDAHDYPQALGLLQECSAELPTRVDVLRDLGLAYYSMGRLAEAEQTMLKVVNQPAADREESQQFLALLVKHRSLGDPAQARQLAESVLERHPGNAAARMVLGLVAEQEGRPTEALSLYEAVLTTYPAFTPAMKRIAILAAEELQDDSLAYRYGIKAHEAAPNDAAVSRVLGEVMYRRGDYRYARQLLQEAVSHTSDDAGLLYYLGLAQYQTRDLQAARQTLARAVALNSKHPLAAQARRALDSM